MATEAPTVLFLRARAGVVGERQRVVHVLAVPTSRPAPEVVTTFCDVRIDLAQADLMDAPNGMPCVMCLARLGVFGREQVQADTARTLIGQAGDETDGSGKPPQLDSTWS